MNGFYPSGFTVGNIQAPFLWGRGFSALGEFETGHFELNEIYFEDHRVRHLICVTPDRYAWLEESSMSLCFPQLLPRNGCLATNVRFTAFSFAIATREVETTMTVNTVQFCTGSRLANFNEEGLFFGLLVEGYEVSDSIVLFARSA